MGMDGVLNYRRCRFHHKDGMVGADDDGDDAGEDDGGENGSGSGRKWKTGNGKPEMESERELLRRPLDGVTC